MNENETDSSRARPPALRAAACWTILLAMTASAFAGGGGGDWYLISREGQFLRKLEAKERDVVDPQSGLIYRLENHVLKATRFEDGTVKWSVPCPLESANGGALIKNNPKVLAIVAGSILYGYDKRNGQELYRAPLGTSRESFALPGTSLRFAWGIDANGEDAGFLYLTREKAKTLVHTNGRVEAVAIGAPELAKFSLSTGAEQWQKHLGTNVIIGSVSPGFIASQPAPACFDPATGDILMGFSTETKPLFTGQMGFLISSENSGTLTAVKYRTQNVLWRLENLGPVRKIIEPHGYDRLLCASDSHVIVIDTLHHQVKTAFQLPGLANASLLLIPHGLVAKTTELFRAVNMESGHILWELPPASAQVTDLAIGGQPQPSAFNEQIPVVEAKGGRKDPDRGFWVVALASQTGKEKWRWPVPEGPWGDRTGVQVHPCAAGYAICRHWIVFD